MKWAVLDLCAEQHPLKAYLRKSVWLNAQSWALDTTVPFDTADLSALRNASVSTEVLSQQPGVGFGFEEGVPHVGSAS